MSIDKVSYIEKKNNGSVDKMRWKRIALIRSAQFGLLFISIFK